MVYLSAVGTATVQGGKRLTLPVRVSCSHMLRPLGLMASPWYVLPCIR